jgi:hypothetical protein
LRLCGALQLVLLQLQLVGGHCSDPDPNFKPCMLDCLCLHFSLSQGGSEKLSDEAIDETLDKVVKLLAYISDKDLFAE